VLHRADALRGDTGNTDEFYMNAKQPPPERDSTAADMVFGIESGPLRNAVTAAVRALGLYQVVIDAGVTRQTLQRYLKGSSMRRGTMTELQKWATLSRVSGTASQKEPPRSRYEVGPIYGSGG
jgi:hypothetical protein